MTHRTAIARALADKIAALPAATYEDHRAAGQWILAGFEAIGALPLTTEDADLADHGEAACVLDAAWSAYLARWKAARGAEAA